MPILEKLNNARLSRVDVHKKCKIFKELARTDLFTEEEKAVVVETLNLKDRYSPDFVPNVVLAQLLKEEGLDVSPSAVDRHRSGRCSCTMIGR